MTATPSTLPPRTAPTTPTTPSAAPPDRNAIVVEQLLLQVKRALEKVEAGQSRMWQRITKVSQRQAAIDAERLLAKEGREPAMPIEFRAQFGEDQFAWDLLNRPTRGFFIEVGAFDGYNFSVSYALEAMGWTGLLIEAHPQAYAKCAARRTRSRVVHAALGRRSAPSTTEFTVVADQYGGMLSYNATTPEHERQVAANRQETTKVTVSQTTMDELLKGHSGGIEVAVLDVEGAEPDLIDGFDLSKHRPRVLIVEDNTRGRNPALDRAMAAHPYRQAAWVEMNRVYVRADDQELLERVAFL